MTPLEKTTKRALNIKGVEYVLTLTQECLKVTQKGRRNGFELRWESLVSGESALALALQASVGKFDAQPLTEKVSAKQLAATSKPTAKRRRS